MVLAGSHELVTVDPAKHRDNLMIYGSSVLISVPSLTPDPPKEED